MAHMRSMMGSPNPKKAAKFKGFKAHQPKYNEPLQLQPLKVAIYRDFGPPNRRQENWMLRDTRMAASRMTRMQVIALSSEQ